MRSRPFSLPTACGFALLLTLGACSDDGADGESGETSGEDLSHAADIQPIWEASCVTGCHAPMGNASFLDLSGDAYAVLVDVESGQAAGVDFVVTGDSGASYLVNKLRNTQAGAGGSGAQMPLGGSLDEASIATIEAWIDAGAMP